MSLTEAHASVLPRFTQFLATRLGGIDGRPAPVLGEETSLFRSGLVDSLALVDVLMWIETEIGMPLDEAAIDDLKRADTVGAVGQFILAARARTRPELSTPIERPTPAPLSEATVVTYQPALRADVLALQVHLWGKDRERNDQYLGWKYEQNPYQREPLIYLVHVGGQAVGMRGFYGSEWELGDGQRLRTVCAGDLVVHPEYRNRGVIPRLMEYATADLRARGFRYIFSLSAGLVTHVASLALGWRGIGALDVRGRPCPGAKGFLNVAADRIRRRVPVKRRPFERFDRMASRRAGPVRSEAPDPEALAAFVSRLGHDGRLRHVRSSEYFAWRLANPLSVYRVLTWRDDRLDGYLILQSSAKQPTHATIVDWEATTPSIRATLLRTAIDWGAFDRLVTWSATLPPDARHLLRETGFRRDASRDQFPVTQRTVLVADLAATDADAAWTLNGRSLLDIDRWDIRMLYWDGG